MPTHTPQDTIQAAWQLYHELCDPARRNGWTRNGTPTEWTEAAKPFASCIASRLIPLARRLNVNWAPLVQFELWPHADLLPAIDVVLRQLQFAIEDNPAQRNDTANPAAVAAAVTAATQALKPLKTRARRGSHQAIADQTLRELVARDGAKIDEMERAIHNATPENRKRLIRKAQHAYGVNALATRCKIRKPAILANPQWQELRERLQLPTISPAQGTSRTMHRGRTMAGESLQSAAMNADPAAAIEADELEEILRKLTEAQREQMNRYGKGLTPEAQEKFGQLFAADPRAALRKAGIAI